MQKYNTKTVYIKRNKFNAIIADTTVKRMIGLMFRKRLRENECMLFIFGNEGFHAIWMHNMLFPIDAIWLDSNYSIIDIKENLKPCGSMMNCPEYSPGSPAKYVIEFNSGAVKRLALTKKSEIKL